MNIIVTTAQQTMPVLIQQAKAIAGSLSAPFVPRENYSLKALKETYQVSELIVVTSTGPLVHTAAGEYFFHLSMADLRIKNLQNGNPDHMVTAMRLRPGMSVLDCTLGLATDAIVASFAVGEAGAVIGLESSPVIALITRYGLEQFTVESEPCITQALRRIKVEAVDYSEYLRTLPDKSMDIVYFDPMFRVPILTSSNVKPIRTLANMQPVSLAAIEQAYRVAKQRVVVKEAAGSREFARLGIAATVGGKYSSIAYGVIECQQPQPAEGGWL